MFPSPQVEFCTEHAGVAGSSGLSGFVMTTYAPSFTKRRRRKADAAIATRHKCNLSFELTHLFPPPAVFSEPRLILNLGVPGTSGANATDRSQLV
jgi:hypothetical protein